MDLINKIIPYYGDKDEPLIRQKYGKLAAWVSIIGNTLLFIIKLILGFLLNSITLMADSFHTISDSLTSVILLLSFRIASKKADKEHPFGHGRMESIATLIIAILLAVAGFAFLKSSIGRIIYPQNLYWNTLAFIILIGSAIFKELMARFAYAISQKINSDAIKADAFHHRSDALATLLVLISLIAGRYKFFAADGILGLIVCSIIWASSYQLSIKSINSLIGEAPSEELINNIKGIALSINGVNGVHEISIHHYGYQLFISLHILVNKNIKTKQAHRIASEVENELKDKLKIPSEITVHVEPDIPKERI